MDDPVILQGLVSEYYKTFFIDNETRAQWFQTNTSYPQIGVYAMEKPMLSISDEEVRIALFGMSPWKASTSMDLQQIFEEELQRVSFHDHEIW